MAKQQYIVSAEPEPISEISIITTNTSSSIFTTENIVAFLFIIATTENILAFLFTIAMIFAIVYVAYILLLAAYV